MPRDRRAGQNSFSVQLFGAAFRCSYAVQPFGAAFRSSYAVQPFGAAAVAARSGHDILPTRRALLCRVTDAQGKTAFRFSFSVQPFGAAFRCSLSVQLFGAAFRCSFSVQPFGAAMRCSYAMQLCDAASDQASPAAAGGFAGADRPPKPDEPPLAAAPGPVVPRRGIGRPFCC